MLMYIITEILAYIGGHPINIEKEIKKEFKRRQKEQKRNSNQKGDPHEPTTFFHKNKQ